ncbi:MAG: hypothetical protein BGO59_22940 [Spirosoma sp. 48-14]|nr:MAG: hypothetical protein BGO59_22940 [Spirosoma sp. 48-14]
MIAVKNLLKLINSTQNLINKGNNINNIIEGIDCFKEIAFSHISYNAPSWNDVQSGSIALNRTRGHIFYSTRQYLDILWNFNINVFYDIVYKEITKEKDISLDISYRIITIYKDFLHKNISHNSKKILRYYYIKNISSINTSLYKLLYNKLIEKDINIDLNLHDIYPFSPFNIFILDSSIKYEDPEISSLLLNDYLHWCDFVIENYKYSEFTSILIGEVIGLLHSLLIHLDELNNIQEQTQETNSTKERLTQITNGIIDHFQEFNFSNNIKDRSIISVINSRFWSFKELDLKNIKSVDSLFINKIEQIISNTVWANTYENTPLNNQSKIPKNYFLDFTLKMISILFR